MQIIIKHDYSCINDFINTFKNKINISESDIINFISKPSYQTLIKDIGKNFSLDNDNDWVDIFNLAYKSFKSNSNLKNESFFVNLAMLSISDAFKYMDSLLDYTKEVIEVLDEKEFIEKASYYLPRLSKDVSVTVVYSVFMRNALVENNKIYIDIPFTRLLSKTQLNDLLSHELHHYLKEFCEPKIVYPKSSNSIESFLRMLENEGIANLCNFKSIYPIYKLLGLNVNTCIDSELENVNDYMISFLKSLESSIDSNNLDVSFNDAFIENLKYISMSYHMAKTILDIYDIEFLRSLVGKPIPFFIKYLDCSNLNLNNKYLSEKSISKLLDMQVSTIN